MTLEQYHGTTTICIAAVAVDAIAAAAYVIGGGTAVAVAPTGALIVVAVDIIHATATIATTTVAAVHIIVHNMTAIIRLRTSMCHVHFNPGWYKIAKCIFDADGRF